MSTLAIFDLDETLLAGDSDYQWGLFLVEKGVLERAEYDARVRAFYELYRSGRLSATEFLDFKMYPLADFTREQLDAWHAEFLRKRIAPMVRPGAWALLDRHRQDTRVIVTGTNEFVTGPIAEHLRVPALIATTLEVVNGRFTGRGCGTPCFREGKIVRLEEWLASCGRQLSDYGESWFYTDSINDLPLLSRVTHPVAVHPDDRLRAHALSAGWRVLAI